MENKFKTKKRLIWIFAVVVAVILISVVIIRIKQVQHIPSQIITPWALKHYSCPGSFYNRGLPCTCNFDNPG